MILEAEAAAYHEPHFAKHAAEYGEGIRGLVEIGLTRPAAAYVRADRARRRFRDGRGARLHVLRRASSARPRPRCRRAGSRGPATPRSARRGARPASPRSRCRPASRASGLPNAVQLVTAPERSEILLHFAAWCEDVLGFTAAPGTSEPDARSQDRGRTVIDGTGAAGARTDVGVRDDTIVAVGDLSREHAGRSLNASGKVLAPGFIDMHSHSDWRLWENRRAESKIRQGVTTEVVGNCGFSPAPVRAGVPRRPARLRAPRAARAWTSRGRRSATT